MKSRFVVTVVGERVNVAAESTFEYVLWLYFDPLRTLANLMPDLGAVVADIILWLVFRKLFEEFLRSLEIFLHEYFGVVVWAFCTLLTKSIHIVPTKLAHNMFKFASFTVETETHVEVGATFVNVPKGAVLSFFAFLPHEIRTDF
jgi:hypothetical protein